MPPQTAPSPIAQRLQVPGDWQAQTAALGALSGLLDQCQGACARQHAVDGALSSLPLLRSPRSQVAIAAVAALRTLCKSHARELESVAETIIGALLGLAFPPRRSNFLTAASREALDALMGAARPRSLVLPLLSRLGSPAADAAAAWLAFNLAQALLALARSTSPPVDRLILERVACAAVAKRSSAAPAVQLAAWQVVVALYELLAQAPGAFLALVRAAGVPEDKVRGWDMLSCRVGLRVWIYAAVRSASQPFSPS